MIARLRQRSDTQRRPGQAVVEFAVVGTVFLIISIGAIDFGRSVYLYSQMNNAVRDSTRMAKVQIANGNGLSYGAIENRVYNALEIDSNTTNPRPGLDDATVSISCTGGCTSGDRITVSASMPFRTVTQQLLGISPFTMNASSTVTLE
jgi:Flp pilus assembly protein TadG